MVLLLNENHSTAEKPVINTTIITRCDVDILKEFYDQVSVRVSRSQFNNEPNMRTTKKNISGELHGVPLKTL